MQNVDPTTMTNEEAAAYLKSALNTYLSRLAEQVKSALETLNAQAETPDEEDEDLDSIFDDDDEDEDDDWDSWWDDDEDEDEDEDEEPEAQAAPALKFSVGDTVKCATCGTRKIARVEPDNIFGRFYYLDGPFGNVGHFEKDLTLVEAKRTAKYAVGDILECPSCGKGKVLSIEENEDYVRYNLEGIGKHYEAYLTKVEPTPEPAPAPAKPKFKEGDWVRGMLTGHYGRVVGMGEPFPFSRLPMYTVYVPAEDRTYDKYEGGLERADMPAPKFQVGQRVIVNWGPFREDHAVITGVSIDEDNDYRFDFRTDEGVEDRLFDFQWGLRDSSVAASNLIRLERDEVPF